MRSSLLACMTVFCGLMTAAEPPIVEAVRSGNIGAVREMVDAKRDVLARGSRDETALHEAAAICSLEAAELLVDAGVNPSLRDNMNRTAAMVAIGCPPSATRDKLVRALLVAVAPRSSDETAPWSLHDAAARGSVGLIHMLVKLGSDVNAVGTKGNRALDIACRGGKVDVVKALLQYGADVRLKTSAGSTALHEAALGGSAEVIALLVARGAEVNAVDAESGATALHYAASFGRLPAVRVLLERGADARRKNGKGLTPLAVAEGNGQTEVARFLRGLASK